MQKSGAYVGKNEIYVNKTKRSWEFIELELQESFKLKTGGKGEVWKNTQFGSSSQISLLRKKDRTEGNGGKWKTETISVYK